MDKKKWYGCQKTKVLTKLPTMKTLLFLLVLMHIIQLQPMHQNTGTYTSYLPKRKLPEAQSTKKKQQKTSAKQPRFFSHHLLHTTNACALGMRCMWATRNNKLYWKDFDIPSSRAIPFQTTLDLAPPIHITHSGARNTIAVIDGARNALVLKNTEQALTEVGGRPLLYPITSCCFDPVHDHQIMLAVRSFTPHHGCLPSPPPSHAYHMLYNTEYNEYTHFNSRLEHCISDQIIPYTENCYITKGASKYNNHLFLLDCRCNVQPKGIEVSMGGSISRMALHPLDSELLLVSSATRNVLYAVDLKMPLPFPLYTLTTSKGIIEGISDMSFSADKQHAAFLSPTGKVNIAAYSPYSLAVITHTHIAQCHKVDFLANNILVAAILNTPSYSS